MANPGDLKDKQRRHWDDVADGWGTWLEWTQRNFAPVTDWLRDALRWQPGARVLDVACGSGFPSLIIAAEVAPAGSVLAADLSHRMLTVAAAAADAANLRNITFRLMDAEELDLASASFDIAVNTYGLMFCPEPARAIAEARRVLVPGGRFGVVVWDDPAKSPYFSVITDVAVKEIGFRPPAPGGPGPFRFADADGLAALMREGGFSDVRVESCPCEFRCASADEYCRMVGELAWKARMAELSSEQRARFQKRVDEASRRFASGGELHLIATSLCVAGVKAPENGSGAP